MPKTSSGAAVPEPYKPLPARLKDACRKLCKAGQSAARDFSDMAFPLDGRIEAAMNHARDLVQADRYISECKARIVRQREVIASDHPKGRSTTISESMLRALEEGLRALEKHRQLIIDQLREPARDDS
jgi:hypothetical protein